MLSSKLFKRAQNRNLLTSFKSVGYVQSRRAASAASVDPLVLNSEDRRTHEPATPSQTQPPVSAVLHRTLKSLPPQIVSANGKYVTFSDGHTIFDTTCGAAVACIGYNNKRVKKAMMDQIDKFSYTNSMFFGHPIGEELATELVNGTQGVMSKAYIMSSGKSIRSSNST